MRRHGRFSDIAILAILMAGIGVATPGPVRLRAQTLSPSPIPNGKTLLKELSNVSIDPGNTFRVKEVNIDRDAIHLTLHRGTLAFLMPVQGHVTGAVFVGNGEILVIPPNKIERFQLNKFTGSPILAEPFIAAVFQFTDNTFQQFMKGVDQSAPPELAGLDLRNAWDEAIRSLSRNLNYRLLQDLVSTHPLPFFHASLNGRTLGWFEVTDDARAFEPILIGHVTHTGESSYPDVWCSFRPDPPRSRESSGIPAALQLYDLRTVDIDADISPDAHLAATAKLNLTFLRNGDRMIPFELSRNLKLSSVEDETGRPLEFFQNTLLEADEIAQRGNDLIYVLLDQPTQRQVPTTLIFKYEGNVIANLGNGIYFVGSRGTWYPNHGLYDAAVYHLKFRYPANMTLVATGNLSSETTEGSIKTSQWDSGGLLGVAGFNYGDYLTKSQKEQDVDVEVYANRGLETMITNLQMRLDQIQAARIAAAQQAHARGLPPPLVPDHTVIPRLSTQAVLSNVIEEADSALKFLESWFGPYPYKKLAISQISGHFGQGWPSLCYVSTLTFFSREQLEALGMSQENQTFYSYLLRAHEISHQWWGDLITAESYHDTWLMEGTATYAAQLYAEFKNPREKNLDVEMKQLQARLEEKTKDGQPVESAGPIWLGWRLFSSQAPTGYEDLVYNKGAWILHMLRMLMQDPKTESDARFISFVKSFLASRKNQPVSTEDFKKALEEQMTPLMDLDGNHRMDWFFDEWVYDVGIPDYRFKYSIGGTAEKGFYVSGRIEQDGVPDSFEMPVPLFAHYGGHSVLVGHIIVSGKETSFRLALTGAKTRPSKISLNDNQAVLCNVKLK